MILDHFTISCLLVGTHICSIKILRLHEKIFYGKHLLRAHRAYNGWKDEEGERGRAEVSIKQAERAERSPFDDVLMILTGPGAGLEGEHKSPISNLFFGPQNCIENLSTLALRLKQHQCFEMSKKIKTVDMLMSLTKE